MKKLMLLLPLFIMALFSCNDDDDKNAHLRITMIDAPADYDSVFVEIQDVRISSSEADEGWTSLAGVNTGKVNLLELVGGLEAVLADAEVTPGRLNQIRLVLGDNNELVIGENRYDLGTPSAQTSGLKIQVHQDLEAGVTYKIQLDFDAAKSIVEKGNGSYSLKPVIRAIVEAQSGAIIGKVTNGKGALVSTTVNGEAINTYVNDDGQFVLAGVPAGTHTVTITPTEDSGLATYTKEGVAVELGKATDIGEVTLEAAQ